MNPKNETTTNDAALNANTDVSQTATHNNASPTNETPKSSRPPRPRGRRMRRSKTPTGKPRARCSRRPANSIPRARRKPSKPLNSRTTYPHQPRFPKPRSTPFQLLPELASLPEADIDYIHFHIRTESYADTIKFLWTDYQISITVNRLSRYRARLDLAEQLQDSEDNAPAIENILALLSGKPVDIDTAALHVIKQRALALAARPDTAPSVLMQLFRVFTWERRQAVAEQRNTLAEQRNALMARREKCRERITKITEKRFKAEQKEARAKAKEKKWTTQEKMDLVMDEFGCFPDVVPCLDVPFNEPLNGSTSDSLVNAHSNSPSTHGNQL